MEHGKQFQLGLLIHLAHDEVLLRQAIDQYSLQVEDFGLPIYQVMWEALSTFYSKHRRMPDPDLLWQMVLDILRHIDKSESPYRSRITAEEAPALMQVAQQVLYLQAQQLNSDYYRERMVQNITEARMRRLLVTSNAKLNDGSGPGPVMDEFVTLQRQLEGISRPLALGKLTGNFESLGLYTRPDTYIRMPTCLHRLDRMLNGGPMPGHLCMFTGTPGLGKSNSLVNVAVAGTLDHKCRALVITLELPDMEMRRRYTAMAMCIPGKMVVQLMDKWTPRERNKARLLLDPGYAAYGRLTVHECIDRAPTIGYIDSVVHAWKDEARAKFGTDRECLLVCIDWLDLILGPEYKKKSPTWEQVTEVNRELKRQIASKHNVVLWTATQGTREADGKAVVRMKHTAGAYHKNDALDVGIGLGTADDQLEDVDTKQQISESGRTMVLTVNKHRYGDVGSMRVYQAPTLRMYDTVSDYNAHRFNVDKQVGDTDNEIKTATPEGADNVNRGAAQVSVR